MEGYCIWMFLLILVVLHFLEIFLFCCVIFFCNSWAFWSYLSTFGHQNPSDMQSWVHGTVYERSAVRLSTCNLVPQSFRSRSGSFTVPITKQKGGMRWAWKTGHPRNDCNFMDELLMQPNTLGFWGTLHVCGLTDLLLVKFANDRTMRFSLLLVSAESAFGEQLAFLAISLNRQRKRKEGVRLNGTRCVRLNVPSDSHLVLRTFIY